ncbi:MAG: ubiquinol-cytochrome C chaperone family protein [Ahrensia sp.]|nr:ubiquinol-cytochrome C chaperone family protein [Ahrensia sp.]
MIMSLFRRKKDNSNEKIVSRLYSSLIAAGRQPLLYANWGVPDTPIGRYEAIGLHLILFFHRIRSSGDALNEMAQNIVDEFFLELDHSVRELGVGDAGVPKRMKKLGKMFYGRMGPYWTAIDSGDATALADALTRNITPKPETDGILDSDRLAQYMLDCVKHLATISNDQLLRGEISFPPPGT